MTYKVVPIFSLIFILSLSLKVHSKNEKIRFFLTEYEITKAIETERRIESQVLISDQDSEKSLTIKAFGKTFILDLDFYYQKEDSELLFVRKLQNISDSFLASNFLLHYGFVRDVKDSYVLGFCSTKEKLFFRGYFFTDEIYCVEPYEKDSLIVYRFKDVIVPGCSKLADGADLDCSDTLYFSPWKANKPPKKAPKKTYRLFYDKYFDLYNNFKAKADTTGSGNSKNNSIAGNKGKNDDATKTRIHDHNSDKGQRKDGKKGSHKDCDEEDKDVLGKHGANTTGGKDHEQDKNVKKSNKKGNRNKLDEQKSDDDYLFLLKALKSVEFDKYLKDNTPRKYASREVPRKDDIFESIPYKPSAIAKESLHEFDGNLKEDVKNRNKKFTMHPVAETLEEDVPELQCNVEVVVGPSYRKKFQNSNEKVMKDIYTQITLLNKIFHKVILKRKGKSFHLSLLVDRIVMYADEVYNPFTEDGDLEYFTKKHQKEREFCLTIGLVNQFLVSGQLFDGYIPEGGGGVCADYGNTVIVSHGNDNTPAPMGLFFASLVRAVTRALGANDRDAQCQEGSYPNPMIVLQEYLLAKTIYPGKQYSIFTACNVNEIGQALSIRECLLKIPSSLCGNGILDEGEECDCGPTIFCAKIDSCCKPPRMEVSNDGYKGCTLVKGAKCGSSQPCCVACEIMKGQNPCYSGHNACDIGMCDGKSAACPTGVEASNGMVCSDFNETMVEPLICKDGKCEVPLCSGFDLKPCSCAPGTGRDCAYCCVKDGKCRSAGSELRLIEGRNFLLPDGMECMGGMCIGGKCSSLSGQQQILNITIRKAPKLPTIVNACSTLSALTTTISSLLSFFVLFLF